MDTNMVDANTNGNGGAISVFCCKMSSLPFAATNTKFKGVDKTVPWLTIKMSGTQTPTSRFVHHAFLLLPSDIAQSDKLLLPTSEPIHSLTLNSKLRELIENNSSKFIKVRGRFGVMRAAGIPRSYQEIMKSVCFDLISLNIDGQLHFLFFKFADGIHHHKLITQVPVEFDWNIGRSKRVLEAPKSLSLPPLNPVVIDLPPLPLPKPFGIPQYVHVPSNRDQKSEWVRLVEKYDKNDPKLPVMDILNISSLDSILSSSDSSMSSSDSMLSSLDSILSSSELALHKADEIRIDFIKDNFNPLPNPPSAPVVHPIPPPVHEQKTEQKTDPPLEQKEPTIEDLKNKIKELEELVIHNDILVFHIDTVAGLHNGKLRFHGKSADLKIMQKLYHHLVERNAPLVETTKIDYEEYLSTFK